jgi:hypothetical protein
MPDSYTEGRHAGEFLYSEASGVRSRENVVVQLGSGVLSAGAVLGRVTVGAITAAAQAGNTGNGTISAVTAAAGIKPGAYAVTFIEPISNLGTYVLEDPIGITIGRGFVGTAFSSGHLSFTISDGATDFVAGDRFNITVAAGNGQYRPFDPANTDGSSVAAGILYDNLDATSAAVPAVAFVRDCEVYGVRLSHKAGMSAPNQALALEQLRALGVVAR